MADIAPLTPLRYDLEKKDLAKVVAPPYDVISPEQREELAARDPHNIVKLILPEGEGDTKYANAGKLFAQWQEEKVLVRDPEPAFYRYAQTFQPPGGGEKKTRRGFLGLVRVVPLDQKIVLPHERTLSGPKEDRLKLFRATKTNLSPGFMLYRDENKVIDHCIDTAKSIAAFDTADGIHHDLGKITEPEAVHAIVAAIQRSTLLIADGHHRYETALRYSQENPGPSASHFMVFFANGDDPNLLVFPTHRHVHDLPSFDFASLLEKAKGLFDVTPLPPGASSDVLLDALAKAGPGAIVACAGDARAALFVVKKGADLAAHAVLGQTPEALRTTDVALLHMGLLEPILGVTKEMQAAKSNIWYPQDAKAAVGELRSGKGQVLFLMNATPTAEVRRVAEAGEVMPQKSTFFHPKVLTGLAVHTL